MYNIDEANNWFIATAAYLARDLYYDPESKHGQTQIENWREAVMKLINQHKSAHKELRRLREVVELAASRDDDGNYVDPELLYEKARNVLFST